MTSPQPINLGYRFWSVLWERPRNLPVLTTVGVMGSGQRLANAWEKVHHAEVTGPESSFPTPLELVGNAVSSIVDLFASWEYDKTDRLMSFVDPMSCYSHIAGREKGFNIVRDINTGHIYFVTPHAFNVFGQVHNFGTIDRGPNGKIYSTISEVVGIQLMKYVGATRENTKGHARPRNVVVDPAIGFLHDVRVQNYGTEGEETLRMVDGGYDVFFDMPYEWYYSFLYGVGPRLYDRLSRDSYNSWVLDPKYFLPVEKLIQLLQLRYDCEVTLFNDPYFDMAWPVSQKTGFTRPPFPWER